MWCSWLAACLRDFILEEQYQILLWYTKNRCAPIYTRPCFPGDSQTKTGPVLHWIHLSLNVCAFECVRGAKGLDIVLILWKERVGKKERVRVGLWLQFYRASVVNFWGADVWLLVLRYCTPCPSTLCLQYFHIRIIQLSKHCCAVPSDSPCELYYEERLLFRVQKLSFSLISFWDCSQKCNEKTHKNWKKKDKNCL